MKLTYKKAIIPLFLIIASLSFGQNSNYNLPPGYRFHPERAHILDLSFKLDGKTLAKPIGQKQLEFLKNLDDSQLHLASAEYQNYIQQGKAFIQSLSPKVKSIYTEKELWYIYAFDRKLKKRLVKIK
jgi:hypothetical protein